MALPSGARLGPFEIIGLLGAGGMGEVYRATDTHLKRAVAIKVLPAAVSADPARLARSQREAEMLAALNHPNIGAIYGLERCEGLTALVLELVEGPTLADRIAQGAVRLDEALPIAVQIADALEAAHDRGIVHRDLKPANIKVRPDGTVKVLDFGLAKASHVEGGPGSTPYDASMSPTMAAPAMTEAGLILGTVAYMSPEQARGKAVGKQADIWAFGCVLYEMLSGRMAFHGETVSDTIAAVLGREPDWAALPSSTPANIRQMLRHLLAKDPKRRLRDAGDVRLALTELATPERDGQSRPPDSRDVPARRTRTSIVAAVLAGVALGALGVLAISARGASDSLDTSAYRFTPLAADPADEGSPAWSPDGKAIVYVAEKDGVRQLFVRSLDGAVPTQITKSATDCSAPFWSHDGRRIFFIDVGGTGGGAGQLRSVGVAGGEPQLVLNDVAAATIAPDDETLAFLRGPGGSRSLWTTALGAGEPRRYETAPFPATFGLSSSVQFSPDGKSLGVLVRRQDGASYRSQLWVLPYPTGIPRPVLDGIPEAAAGRLSWLPDNRHIVWDTTFPDRAGRHLYVADTARSTIRQVTFGTVDELSPSVSPDGARIAFAAGADDFDLVSVPLDGAPVQTLLASARIETRPSWSPDGTQIAYATNAHGATEIWVRSIAEGWAQPIVKSSAEGSVSPFYAKPTWSPDAQRIAYEVIGAKHGVWVAPAGGGRGVPLDEDSPDEHSPAWSPDGNWIAYQRLGPQGWELVKVSLGGGKPVRLGEAAAGGGDHTAWSPDGTWIAHVRRGALWLTSPDQDHAEKTLSGPPPSAFGFSRDGSVLYAVRHAPDRSWEVARFDVRTGMVRATTTLALPQSATLTGFSLHPDGRTFATALGLSRHDVWLLDGFRLPARLFGLF